MQAGKILVLTLAVTLLNACSTTSSRIKQQQAIFDSYPAEIQESIRNGEIKPGFTAEMVHMALGKPSQTVTQATIDGTLTTLSFSKKRPAVGFSIGGGSYGGASSVGGGVGIGAPARGKFTHIVELVDGKVTQIKYFGD